METGTVNLSLGHPLGVLAPGLDSRVQGDQALDTGGSSQMDMAIVAWEREPTAGFVRCARTLRLPLLPPRRQPSWRVARGFL